MANKNHTIANLHKKNKEKSGLIKSLNRKLKTLTAGSGCAATTTAPQPGSHYSKVMIILCVCLRVVAGCSFRSIPVILLVVELYYRSEFGVPFFCTIPCANTVENWFKKCGLYDLMHLEELPLGGKIGLIIDESMYVGEEKLLVILAIDADKTSANSLDMGQAHLVLMQRAKSWDSKRVTVLLKQLQEVFNGRIVYAVADDCKMLNRVILDSGLVRLSDVSHAVALCLEQVFKQDGRFVAFTAEVQLLRSRDICKAHSYLLPPKQRTIARFMNQHKIVKWATAVLKALDKLAPTEKEVKANKVILNNL